MMIASNCSGVVTAAVARTIRSWLLLVSEPAGVSKATEESAVATSATVRPSPESFA